MTNSNSAVTNPKSGRGRPSVAEQMAVQKSFEGLGRVKIPERLPKAVRDARDKVIEGWGAPPTKGEDGSL